MLRAYAGMPSEEFVAQLRTFVITLGLPQQVIDCVDNLKGITDDEDERAESETKIEEEAEERGRKDASGEIIDFVTKQLDDAPNLSGEAVLALLEKAYG